MEKQTSGFDLIRWQDCRNRRPRRGVSIWTAALVICVVCASLTLAAQAFGIVGWSPPLTMAAAGLLFVACCTQIMAVARAVVAWLVG